MDQGSADSRTVAKFHLIPWQEDLLSTVATLLIEQHEQDLPLLNNTVILLPDVHAAPMLRRKLLERAREKDCRALLGPHVLTIKNWVRSISPMPEKLINHYHRELILLNELKHHRHLFGTGSLWGLAENLLKLFDELNLQHVPLPASADALARELAQGYKTGEENPEALEHEARLVYTLWQSWQQHMSDHAMLDDTLAYVTQLRGSLETIKADSSIYIVCPYKLGKVEQEWLQELTGLCQCNVIMHGEADAETDPVTAQLLKSLPVQDYSNSSTLTACSFFINTCLTPSHKPLLQRAAELKSTFPSSPLQDIVSVFNAHNGEEEVQAISTQLALWLQAGKQNIAVVTEDRKLARRLRAFLERYNIVINDSAGWALSTTQSASVVERWLQTVEQSFYHEPLLDLLKSPFIQLSENHEEFLQLVYFFETTIVRDANIPRGLEHYLKQLQIREGTIPAPPQTADGVGLHDILGILKDASAPLGCLLNGEHVAAAFIQALKSGLQQLGIAATFQHDPAGQRIWQELEMMEEAGLQTNMQLSWVEFRTWLGYKLEHYNFVPPASASGIKLLSLENTVTANYDAIVIAGVEEQFYPGQMSSSPFFNNGVRQQLGLNDKQKHYQSRFYLFRRLLQAAPHLLLTHRSEQDGEEIAPSPWLALMQTMHELAYGDNLGNRNIAPYMRQTSATHEAVANSKSPDTMPRPHVIPGMLPESLSASDVQMLMTCPYRYYASRCLQLKAPQEVQELLEKSDYGSLVHRCLEAFHQNVKDLPGPWSGKLNPENMEAAQVLLNRISETLFNQQGSQDFIDRAWLHRWQLMIPVYLQWQMQRQQHWRFFRGEIRIQHPQMAIHGVIDRVDKQDQELAIIDYKTGYVAPKYQIEAGEEIQLPFYTLLAEAHLEQAVTQVEYLKLEGEKTETRKLEGETLIEIKQQLQQRLSEMITLLHDGAAMPAWGTNSSCQRCEFDGLCRTGLWQ